MRNCKDCGWSFGPEMTIDERVIPFDGRLCFKTYNPGKRDERGIRIYSNACPRTNYIYDQIPYLGKKYMRVSEEGLGKYVRTLSKIKTKI